MEATDQKKTSYTQDAMTTIDSLEAFEKQYTRIPVEAIIKQDVLRLGVHFDEKSGKGRLQNQGLFYLHL